MRIFIGIDLDPEVRARIERFLEGAEGFAPDARWVRPESLHITLKFIGEQAPEQVEAITERLRRGGGGGFENHLAGYGFFPDAKAPPAVWVGIHPRPRPARTGPLIDAGAAGPRIPPGGRPY